MVNSGLKPLYCTVFGDSKWIIKDNFPLISNVSRKKLNSEGILRNQKLFIDLESFSVQRLIYLAPFRLCSTTLLKDTNLQ